MIKYDDCIQINGKEQDNSSWHWKAEIRKFLYIEEDKSKELSKAKDENYIDYLTLSFGGLGEVFFSKSHENTRKSCGGFSIS